MIIAR